MIPKAPAPPRITVLNRTMIGTSRHFGQRYETQG